jgi:hypothetical protein
MDGSIGIRSATTIIAGLILALLSPSAFSPSAAEDVKPLIPVICVDREIAVITLIDDHAMVEDVVPDKLSTAFSALLDARALCYGGQTSESVAAYDAILKRLGHLHIGRKE